MSSAAFAFCLFTPFWPSIFYLSLFQFHPTPHKHIPLKMVIKLNGQEKHWFFSSNAYPTDAQSLHYNCANLFFCLPTLDCRRHVGDSIPIPKCRLRSKLLPEKKSGYRQTRGFFRLAMSGATKGKCMNHQILWDPKRDHRAWIWKAKGFSEFYWTCSLQ